MLPENPIKSTFGLLIRDYKYLINQFSTELLSLKKPDNKEQDPYDLIAQAWLDPDYYLRQATNMHLDNPKPSSLARQTMTASHALDLLKNRKKETEKVLKFRSCIRSRVSHLKFKESTIQFLINFIFDKLILKLCLFDSANFTEDEKMPLYLDFERNCRGENFLACIPAGMIKATKQQRWHKASEHVEEILWETGLSLSNNEALPIELDSENPEQYTIQQVVNFGGDDYKSPFITPLPVTSQQVAIKLVALVEGKVFLLIQNEIPLYLLLSTKNNSKQQAIKKMRKALAIYQSRCQSGKLDIDPDEREWLEGFELDWVNEDIKTVNAIPYFESPFHIENCIEQEQLAENGKLFQQIIDTDYAQTKEAKFFYGILPNYSLYIDPVDPRSSQGHKFEFWSVIIDTIKDYEYSPFEIYRD